jgi:hypothetical protein
MVLAIKFTNEENVVIRRLLNQAEGNRVGDVSESTTAITRK